jgi:glycine hydroxymethyltransferase
MLDPGIIDNYHPGRVAALALAALEMSRFGENYAAQVIRNSRRLAEELYSGGLPVLCEKVGFTRSHQVIIDMKKMNSDGNRACSKLSQANIISSRARIFDDQGPVRGGVRLGTAELTRLGMTESEMKEVASFLQRSLIKNEDSRSIKRDVVELMRHYQTLHFSIDEGSPAYA